MMTTPLKAVDSAHGHFEFTSDARGRTIAAEGWLSNQAAVRDPAAQSSVSNGLTGFHAGHLIPARFGGPGGLKNLVPIPALINVSYVKAVENAIARHLSNGPVYLRVLVRYGGADPVPQLLTHEFYRQGRSGIEPIPGGEVTTFVPHVPSAPMGSIRDPYTGRLISPREWLNPESTKGIGPHGAH
jgi:hypothetical protein